MKKIVIFIIFGFLFYYFNTDRKPNISLTPTHNKILKKKFFEEVVKVTQQNRIINEPQKIISRLKTPEKKTDNSKYIPVDSQGSLYIGHVKILKDEKMLISHGDIIVGDYDKYEDYINGERTLKMPPPKLWEDGKIPYVIAEEEGELFEVINKTIEYFNNNTNLKFLPRDFKDVDYIRFEPGKSNCYSRLGRQGGMQRISLSKACTMQNIAHEILHSLGFLHEQNREDRDEYITILWQNIDIDLHLQFKKVKSSLLPLSATKFSFNSIMLYPSDAFSIVEDDYSIVTANGEGYKTTKEILNQIDMKRIELAYKRELNPK
ncbi:MAG: hypothetical protein HN576_03555 [Bacteriovoracaceae bacterium]|jgi:hypothetical protein|nr:hypothetical protein [Bacteriovoracaceae bacterium]